MNDLSLCPGCFLEPWSDGPCPRCAYEHDSTAFPTALRPGTTLSRYTVGRVLGKPGGFGVTYLGFDPVLKRRVAIKELMPRDLVARRPDGETLHVHTKEDQELFRYTLTSFLNEARLIAQFSHANVVRVLDFFEGNGTAYFVMEYLEGQTLAEYARQKGGRLSGEEAVSLMMPLLDALDHIHTLPEKILHRDIKPANIYLTGRQVPILLDFGAARVAMGQQSRSLSAVLTPGFAPYEQYSTRGNQGPWTDVYGLAATLYYVITGRVPPEANDRVDDPHIDPPSTLAPGLAPHISAAIVAGLGFRPADRPQSARAFADLLMGKTPADAAGIPVTVPLGVPVARGEQHPRTLVLPPQGTAAGGSTEIAPPTIPTMRTERASESGPSTPPPLAAVARPPSTSRRLPLIAAAIAVVLVIGAAVWASQFGGQKSEPKPDVPENTVVEAPPANPPIVNPSPGGGGAVTQIVRPPEPVTPAPGTPIVENPSRGSGAKSGGVAPDKPGDKQDIVTPPAPAPQPPPPPATGVLVVIYGDEPSGTRAAESAILRSLVGRSGLQALDPSSLSMMRGDQSAVQAAGQGDFSALAKLGREHGVELMVVGDLSSRAVPSINKFFTGTAELTVKMYRVSNSRLIDTQTFSAPPQLMISEGEARAKAATAAAEAAAAGVGTWLGRAF